MASASKSPRARTGPIRGPVPAVSPERRSLRYTYVIELRPAVWASTRFRDENPRATARVKKGEVVAAVYVGSSAHRGSCRFDIHRGSTTCSCSLTRTGAVKAGTGSTWVREYGVRLLWDVEVRGDDADARTAETELAVRLRAQGYGVWQR